MRREPCAQQRAAEHSAKALQAVTPQPCWILSEMGQLPGMIEFHRIPIDPRRQFGRKDGTCPYLWQQLVLRRWAFRAPS